MNVSDIEIIADTLCNILDWDSNNLEEDFIICLKENDVQISQEQALEIISHYLKIDAKTRCSARFDYKRFISDHCTF